jgi:thioesterase-3
MKGETKIKVRGYHLDMFSHVNNARYLEFLEEARWDAFEQSNLTPQFFFKRDWSFIVVNINISYKHPATFGDNLTVKTDLKKITTKSIVLAQKISLDKNKTLVVEAEVTFVILDNKTQKALVIDPEIKDLWFNLK